jgi:hypothetical protein
MLKMTQISCWLLSLTLLSSCLKEPEWSVTPEIKFEKIEKFTKLSNDGFGGKTKLDSVVMYIRFQDGDGDLGVTEAEIKSNPAKYKDFRNFEVSVFHKKNGTFDLVTFSPALGGLINFNLKENQKAGAIEGSIAYSTQFVYAFYKGYSPRFTPTNDTLKFQIFIRDNAKNVSNTVETEPIVIFQN